MAAASIFLRGEAKLLVIGIRYQPPHFLGKLIYQTIAKLSRNKPKKWMRQKLLAKKSSSQLMTYVLLVPESPTE